MRPFFLFAPGAGAPSSHPWMQQWKQRLNQLGDVETFDYDYMREGRKRPDRLPELIEAHRSALASARTRADGPFFLIGKSMGGRIGCHVALVEQVAGVICLGYPLCGGGDRTKLRDQVLRELRTAVLLVQGTRDSLCPLELLNEVRAKMEAPTRLHVVDGGDHSLQVPKRGYPTQETVDEMVMMEIRDFCGEAAGGDCVHKAGQNRNTKG